MKIFISWSGNFSRFVGEIIAKYFPTILQEIETFISVHDIASGSRWVVQISDELENTNFGILCLTPSNIQAPWLVFEAGALSKFGDSSLCGLLIGDVKPTDVTGPLSQFQHRRFIKNDIKLLLDDINKQSTKKIKQEQLDLLFEKFWPDIYNEYQEALNSYKETESSPKSRGEKELLEEILFRVRGLEGRASDNIPFSGNRNIDVLDMRVEFDSLAAYTKWKFPSLDISNHWQSQLLADLNTQKYLLIRDIDDAVNLAMPALKEYQKESPNIFRYGTDYITKALGFVDEQFRSSHPWAKQTVDAFIKYKDLVLSNS